MILMYSDRQFKQFVQGSLDPSYLVDEKLIQPYNDLVQFYMSKRYIRMPKVDRTGTLPHFMNIKSYNPIPPPMDITFNDACMIQAGRMIKTDKQIKIFWSGGPDSTVIIVALLKVGIKPNQIKIIMTPNSIEEYPWFFENIIKKNDISYNIQFNGLNTAFDYPTSPDDIWTTGHLAEGIYNNGFVVLCHEDGDYRTIVPESVQEFLAPMIATCPFPIKTLYQYFWYWRFNMVWDEWKYMPRIMANGPIYDCTSLYDCDEMQGWAFNNYKPDYKFSVTDTQNYRPDAKTFIIDYTKDTDYLYKGKDFSFRANKNWMKYKYLNDDFTKEIIND